MKLSKFPDEFWRIISKEEKDLERTVLKAEFIISLAGNNKEIIIHNWEYTHKK